jgi:uncharacterized protein (DUF1800 family)
LNPVNAAIAANRFGLGAKPGELGRIANPQADLHQLTYREPCIGQSHYDGDERFRI